MFFAITSYINGFASLIAAYFVYKKKWETKLAKLFCLLTTSVATYSIFLATAVISRTPSEALFWLRIEHIGNAFIPTAYFHFALEVIKETQKRQKILWLSYILSFVLVFTIPTNLWIAGVRENFAGMNFYPAPGPFYFVYFLMYCSIFIFSEAIVFLASKRFRGKERSQAFFVFLTGFLGSAAGVVTFLPLYGFEVAPNLNCLVILYVMSLAYAILKHGLLDIEVIIKRTLVFAGIVAAAVSAIAFPSALIQAVIGKALGVPDPFILMALGIATAVLIYRPVERVLVNITDRYLFQKKISYRVLLKEASEYLAHVDSLKQQSRTIVAFLLRKARIANASVYVFTSADTSALTLKASRPVIKDESKATIKLTHPVIQYLYHNRGPIDLHAILERSKSEADPQIRDEIGQILHLMNVLKAEAAVPCFGGEAAAHARKRELHLRGILFLGHQKSDEPYTEDDLDVFFTLAQESSIAFENARLYDEAIERSKQLQRINEELVKVQSALLQSLHETETAKNEAVEAKKKTEEMELELVRREKLIFVEKLVKGLAHEIFNPMTPMSYELEAMENAYTELFILFEDFSEKMGVNQKREFFSDFKIIRDGIHALQLGHDHIRRVIDTLTQMQQKNDQSMRPFDIKAFWKMALPMMAMETHGETFAEVPIQDDIQRGLPPVMGNPTQLTQVFINLFRNAMHAMNNQMDKKVMVIIRTDPDNANFVEMRFSDNGSGIPPEILPRIFDFQFTTKGTKGQGIGLSQCKLIIEKFFKGRIRCESEVNKGTTFIICLPIWKGEIINAN